MTRPNKKPFPWFLWHRRLGMVSLLLMIILAVTGIALNHTEGLALDEKNISNDSLLNWYGLNPEGSAVSFTAGNNRISQWSGKLFYNDLPIADSLDNLIGVVVTNDNLIVIAFNNSLLILDANGKLIEHAAPKFAPLTNLGLHDNHVVTQNSAGDHYRADKDIISWTAVPGASINWSQSSELNPILQNKLKQAWRGDGLTAERVILDLHSGRLFNAAWGVYIMDASAVMLLVLSLSGGWMWWTRKRKIAGKKHYQKHHR